MTTSTDLEKELTLLIFTGLMNTSLLAWLFTYYLILVLIPTALFICTENTFWGIDEDGSFVELFKKSFTLYVESGMKDMMKKEIDILRNRKGGFSLTNDFKPAFYKFITEHYLCKFHSLYMHLTHSNHFLCPNIAHHVVSQTSGDQMFEVEQKNGKKFTWWQNLMLKFNRR